MGGGETGVVTDFCPMWENFARPGQFHETKVEGKIPPGGISLNFD